MYTCPPRPFPSDLFGCFRWYIYCFGWVRYYRSRVGCKHWVCPFILYKCSSILINEYRACLALLTGHTALVCQIQLAPGILATGGSDGRVITFSLANYTALHRIAAHDSSVTSLQFDSRFLVTGGNDGRVRLFETKTGNYVRELTEPCESVWKVVYRRDVCAVMCRRAGKTCMEIWSFKPKDQ